jgi:hypothetical protein
VYADRCSDARPCVSGGWSAGVESGGAALPCESPSVACAHSAHDRSLLHQYLHTCIYAALRVEGARRDALAGVATSTARFALAQAFTARIDGAPQYAQLIRKGRVKVN